MTRPTVVLADDHAVVIEGIRRILADDFDVVGTAPDGEQLLAVVAELQPDLVVVDISMPKLNGIAALAQLQDAVPQARFVMLTMHREAAYAVSALDAGAHGFVLKHADPQELVTALRAALAGDVFVSPAIAASVSAAQRAARPRPQQLSRRQRDVLRLVAKGRSMKRVADDLGISVKTVEYHKYRLMELLGVKTTAELIRIEVERGISTTESGAG